MVFLWVQVTTELRLIRHFVIIDQRSLMMGTGVTWFPWCVCLWACACSNKIASRNEFSNQKRIVTTEKTKLIKHCTAFYTIKLIYTIKLHWKKVVLSYAWKTERLAIHNFFNIWFRHTKLFAWLFLIFVHEYPGFSTAVMAIMRRTHLIWVLHVTNTTWYRKLSYGLIIRLHSQVWEK